MKKIICLLLLLAMTLSAGAVDALLPGQTLPADPTGETATAVPVTETPVTPATNAPAAQDGLDPAWQADQSYALADPAPWDLRELKQAVDVHDPRSVAAYYVWACARLTDNYDDGMEMMKYLFADLEPFGRGFTEGGVSGRGGWDAMMGERLRSADYKWLPRAFFDGASQENGFAPARPWTLPLLYNAADTEGANAKTVESVGRLNIVYIAVSRAGGNRVSITVSRFDGSDRWYVTSGSTSPALFYDQNGAVSAAGRARIAETANDPSTAAEHAARYGAQTPFTDVPQDAYYADAVQWAYAGEVTSGTSATTFGPEAGCTRGQVVTFLWRAAGKPQPSAQTSPFRDVSASDYYYLPVLWAVEQGITGGTSADTFSPAQTCSSAHIITFLYRAMGAGTNGWYEEAGRWAQGAGLLEGSGIAVDPAVSCPRGAVVTFLHRAYVATAG